MLCYVSLNWTGRGRGTERLQKAKSEEARMKQDYDEYAEDNHEKETTKDLIRKSHM